MRQARGCVGLPSKWTTTDGSPAEAEGTQLRVQARRDGWSIEELLDAKESGRVEEPKSSTCASGTCTTEQCQWSRRGRVRRRCGACGRNTAGRAFDGHGAIGGEARAAMSSVRGQERGVGKFKMLDALEG